MCKITTVVEFNNNLLYNLSPITDHCWASSLILKNYNMRRLISHKITTLSSAHQRFFGQAFLYKLKCTALLKLMTHSPDFGADFRRRKSAPTSGLCVTVSYRSGTLQIFLVPDSGAGRLRVLFRADFWYARDHYGDR